MFYQGVLFPALSVHLKTSTKKYKMSKAYAFSGQFHEVVLLRDIVGNLES